jgi:hypothetical protein
LSCSRPTSNTSISRTCTLTRLFGMSLGGGEALLLWSSCNSYLAWCFSLTYRHFLAKFKMAGEAQIVDRFMTHFAERFCACCPDVFKFSGANHHRSYRNVCVRLELTVVGGGGSCRNVLHARVRDAHAQHGRPQPASQGQDVQNGIYRQQVLNRPLVHCLETSSHLPFLSISLLFAAPFQKAHRARRDTLRLPRRIV